MNIVWAVAWYELKLILRSRLFRIFAFIAAAVQAGAIMLLYQTTYYSSWNLRAVPSSIPYTAVMLYDSIAMVAGIIIATDFLHRDLRLGSTEATYYRDFPTPVYFLGKAIGILWALFGLGLVILLLPFTFNLFFLSDTPVSVTGYLLHPVLLTLPEMLFVMGLSWLIMVITKNQPLAFLFCLIVLAVLLRADSMLVLHHLSDATGISVPALYSDITGFAGAWHLVMQRGLCAIAGIAGMAFAALRLPRLPQSIQARRITTVLAGILVVGAAILSGLYLHSFASETRYRDTLRALNSEYGSLPRITMTACDLTIRHDGATVSATAAMTFENQTNTPLDTYLLSLNPGFTVEELGNTRSNMEFARDHHLILVKPSVPLMPGDTDSLIISYAGTIDENVCYLDTQETERGDSFRLAYIPVASRSGFITPDYVLLTPETLWYPIAGVPYGSTFPELGRKDFVRFTLSVEASPGMTAVSQGRPETNSAGSTIFRPKTPLPNISLIIAGFDSQSVVIDSVTYAMYYVPGHDYFAPYLEGYDDLIPEQVRELRESFEREYGRAYPYDYFTLVEVPIQFTPRIRTWTIVQDNMQPGMALIYERGTYMRDLPGMAKSFGEEYISDDEYRDMFLRNVLYPVVDNSYSGYMELLSTSSPLFSRGTVWRFLNAQEPATYNAFPNFYSFTNHLYSSRWPLMDAMMERYLAIGITSNSFLGEESFSPGDMANMLLRTQSFADLLVESTDPVVRDIVMSAKMSQLISMFNARNGSEDFFDNLVAEWERTRFTSVSFSVFLDSLYGIGAGEIEDYLDEWYHAADLPICQVHDVLHYEIQHNERVYYQLMTTISNPSDADGLFKLSGGTLYQTDDPAERQYEPFERFVSIPAGEARCVSVIGDDPFYSQITVTTSVSQNLPASFRVPIPAFRETDAIALIDSTLTVDPASFKPSPDVIIVDDVDPGCTVQLNHETSWLQELLLTDTQEELEYVPFNFMNPQTEWKKTFGVSLYGDYVRSAVFKEPGNGTQPVMWRAQIPESGTYDVYTHLSTTLGRHFRIVERGATYQRPNIGTFRYTIHHDTGNEAVDIDAMDQTEEWVLLGSYYFSAGEGLVELSDKSDGRVIYADAIKWVKK